MPAPFGRRAASPSSSLVASGRSGQHGRARARDASASKSTRAATSRSTRTFRTAVAGGLRGRRRDRLPRARLDLDGAGARRRLPRLRLHLQASRSRACSRTASTRSPRSAASASPRRRPREGARRRRRPRALRATTRAARSSATATAWSSSSSSAGRASSSAATASASAPPSSCTSARRSIALGGTVETLIEMVFNYPTLARVLQVRRLRRARADRPCGLTVENEPTLYMVPIRASRRRWVDGHRRARDPARGRRRRGGARRDRGRPPPPDTGAGPRDLRARQREQSSQPEEPHGRHERCNRAGFATLLFDLLTAAEERVDRPHRELRFDIRLLAERLLAAVDAVVERPDTSRAPPRNVRREHRSGGRAGRGGGRDRPRCARSSRAAGGPISRAIRCQGWGRRPC